MTTSKPNEKEIEKASSEADCEDHSRRSSPGNLKFDFQVSAVIHV